MKSHLISVLFVLGLSTTALVSSAHATSAIPQGARWHLRDSVTPRTDWPTNGVIHVYGVVVEGEHGTLSGEQALEFITFEVLDPEGNALTGTLSYIEPRIVWTGDAPFVPQTTYSVTVTADNHGVASATNGAHYGADAQIAFLLPTGDGPAPPAPEPIPGDEVLMASPSTCCPDGAALCHTAPRLEVDLDLSAVDEALLDHYTYLVTSETAACSGGLTAARCTWTAVADQYCYTVQVTSMLDGTTNGFSSCVSNAEVEVSDTTPIECDTSGSDVDAGSGDDDDDDVGVDLKASSGCAVLDPRHEGHSPMTALLGLALLGLVWRRRATRA